MYNAVEDRYACTCLTETEPYQLLEQKVERLKQCLQDIIDPVAALRRDLPDGYKLNGGMVVHLLNDPATYKDIAKRGLEGR